MNFGILDFTSLFKKSFKATKFKGKNCNNVESSQRLSQLTARLFDYPQNFTIMLQCTLHIMYIAGHRYCHNQRCMLCTNYPRGKIARGYAFMLPVALLMYMYTCKQSNSHDHYVQYSVDALGCDVCALQSLDEMRHVPTLMAHFSFNPHRHRHSGHSAVCG